MARTSVRLRLAAVLVAVAVMAGCTDGTDSDPAVATPTSPLTAPTGGPQWQGLAAAPTARTEVAATAAGGRVFVVGGFVADGATVATVEVFDVGTGRWERGPDLPTAVHHAMAATVDETVYVFGGYLSGHVPSRAAFKLAEGRWHAVAELPEGRAAATAVAVDGTVYVAAGIAGGAGQGNRLADRMLVYDPRADRWSTAPGPPTPREHLGGAGFDGLVYTVGGRTGGLAGNLAAVEAYDPGTNAWRTLPDLPTPRGGLAAAATCNGHVVAVGGEARATFAEVEAYDVRAGTWRALPALPTPRHGLGVVAVGTALYTLAGGPQPGLHVSATTEAIDLSSLGRCG